MSFGVANRFQPTAAWRISMWTIAAFAVSSAIAFAVMYVLVARDIQRRNDAWLSGEARVLADVAANTPRDALYERMVQEVAELATREVPDAGGKHEPHSETVFFLYDRPGQEPIWVGPADKQRFFRALQSANLQSGIPASVNVSGKERPYRSVVEITPEQNRVYLGFADHAAYGMMRHMTVRFLLIWGFTVILGFVISSAGAYRTLLRVENISKAVDQIGSEDLSSRLPEGPHNDEITRLSQTFNRMLGRIQASVRQLRVLTDSVAHDLKSPVTSIRGSLEVALSEKNPGMWREQVADAIERLDRLSEMLNTTLDLAEANGGALQLRRESINLTELVQQLIDLYQPSFADRRHELTCKLQPGVVVDADTSLIGRTIANLLDNEVAHLAEGHRISINLNEIDGQAHLTIEDDGSGFPPEVQARPFERFVRGKDSSGHGLGLAFADAVVQAHGGRIQIGQGPLGGAIISLSLPLAPVPA